MKEIKMDYETYKKELADEWRKSRDDFLYRLIKFMNSDQTTNAAWDIFVEDEAIYNPDSYLHRVLSRLATADVLLTREDLEDIKNQT